MADLIMKKKGITPAIIAFIFIGLAALSIVTVGLATDFNFSTFLGASPIDCDGEVVTKTFEAGNTEEAVIQGFADQYNKSYAEEVWDEHNFRKVDSEVKYDVCRN